MLDKNEPIFLLNNFTFLAGFENIQWIQDNGNEPNPEIENLHNLEKIVKIIKYPLLAFPNLCYNLKLK